MRRMPCRVVRGRFSALGGFIGGNNAFAGIFRMQQGTPIAGYFLRVAFSGVPGADFFQKCPGEAFRRIVRAECA